MVRSLQVNNGKVTLVHPENKSATYKVQLTGAEGSIKETTYTLPANSQGTTTINLTYQIASKKIEVTLPINITGDAFPKGASVEFVAPNGDIIKSVNNQAKLYYTNTGAVTFEVKAVGDKVGTFAQSTITVNSTTKSVDLTYKADVTPINPACKDIPSSVPDWSNSENYGSTKTFVEYDNFVWTNTGWVNVGQAPTTQGWSPWTNCGPAVVGKLAVNTTNLPSKSLLIT